MKLKMKMKAEGSSGEVVSAIRPGMKKIADLISKHADSSSKMPTGKKIKLKVK